MRIPQKGLRTRLASAAGAHVVEQPLGEVEHLGARRSARPGFASSSFTRPRRASRGQVALRLFEGGVAAVAGGHHRQLRASRRAPGCARRWRRRRPRPALTSVPSGQQVWPSSSMHLRAQVVQHETRRLLDERETRGDRASPEDRHTLHTNPNARGGSNSGAKVQVRRPTGKTSLATGSRGVFIHVSEPTATAMGHMAKAVAFLRGGSALPRRPRAYSRGKRKPGLAVRGTRGLAGSPGRGSP